MKLKPHATRCMLIAFVSLAAFLGFVILVASCMAVGSAPGA